MGSSNTLLAYEMAIEMRWFDRALQNQGINYFAACEFYKTLLTFKSVPENEWPPTVPVKNINDRVETAIQLEKHFFNLQNVYARKARIKIDQIRASLTKDDDIPEVLEEKFVASF